MSRLKYAIRLQHLFVVAPLLAIAVSTLAQSSSSAAISGIVEDTTDARISDAKVHLFNIDTAIETDSITGKDGGFSIPSVPPGPYRLEVERQEFETVVIKGIVLNVGDNKNIVVRMKVGSSAQTVTVDGSGVSINTTDASVSTVIDRQFVENLPLNGRSFQSLLYLTPGVNLNVSASNNSYTAQGQFVVNGQRGDASYWMIDGVSANVGMSVVTPGAGTSGAVGATNALGGTSALVSVDALQEFRIETSTYAPEFGRVPGGQISIQTRSGTNQFHGTLFDYLRNTDLDAADWFADNQGLRKAAEIQNDFGGVIGGPILRDKTFFFLSAEGLRLILPVTYLGTVPDLAARRSAIPAMQPYLNSYPVPKPGAVDAGPGFAPYSASFSSPYSANAYSLRIDHQLRDNLNLFARYNHAPSVSNQRGGGIFEGPANMLLATGSVTKTATVGATWTESPKVVDDLRLNYSVSGGESFEITDSFGGATPFPGTNLFAPGLSFQNSNIVLVPTFGSNMNEYSGFYSRIFQHQYNAVDTLSVQRGSHSLKFGVDYRRLLPDSTVCHEQIFSLFDKMADYAAGKSYLTITYNNNAETFLLQNLGVFAQDTWRVNSRLNLTYGLRWDVDFRPSTERGSNLPGIVGFSLTNLSNLALAPAGTPPYSTRFGNVAPRIGGAYRISTDPDWGLVLRSGFGVFYGLASTEIFNNNFNNGYYPVGREDIYTTYQKLNYVPFPTPPSAAVLPVVTPPNIQNGETLYGLDPHLNLPYALEWNFALEQSLGRAQTFSLSYIGASDSRTLVSEFITNPNPNYASTDLVGNAGTLSYNALQAQFQRRLSNGLQTLISYTWAHSIDTGSYGAYANGGLANGNANRGDSDYDLRDTFSAAVTYNVPELKNNFFTRAITSGWSTDDVVQIRSGPPIDVTNGNFPALSHENASVVIRCDTVPGQPKYLSGSQYPGRKAINLAYVTNPPVDPSTGNPTRQGDLGRNAFRALGLTQWDFAAHREFPIHEAIKLQFRAELFNILNHPNFGPFNNYFQSGNIYFGQSTQMLNQYLGGTAGSGSQNPLYTPGGPRSGELALKLVF